MRRITVGPIAVFCGFFLVACALAAGGARWTAVVLSLGSLEGPAVLLVFVALLFLFLALANRLFLHWRPLNEGEIAEGSIEEFVYHVNLLFYLLAFYSITRSKFVPVPLMRLVYQLLGARMGPNTYSSGTILDPSLFEAGADTLIGQDSVLFSHAIEGRRLSLARIRLGSGVTIGANAVVMSGVTVGDGAVVAAGSVVQKGTVIGPGEVWGGVPARKLRESVAIKEAAP